MIQKVFRGEIYYANLNPAVGSEQDGIRPVLIIQNDIGNKHSPTTIVAAITCKVDVKPKLPTHCYVGNDNGLELPSIVLLEQIRTIDKRRLKTFIGNLNNDLMDNVDKALLISLGLNISLK